MSIFARIISGEIPSNKLHEDDDCIVIRDIAPQAPVHLLIIPKKPLVNLMSAEETDKNLLGHLLWVANRMAQAHGIAESCRVVINNGKGAGQTVFHLHLHLLGGKPSAESSLFD
jgi:histidine triad (HIT) family protein